MEHRGLHWEDAAPVCYDGLLETDTASHDELFHAIEQQSLLLVPPLTRPNGNMYAASTALSPQPSSSLSGLATNPSLSSQNVPLRYPQNLAGAPDVTNGIKNQTSDAVLASMSSAPNHSSIPQTSLPILPNLGEGGSHDAGGESRQLEAQAHEVPDFSQIILDVSCIESRPDKRLTDLARTGCLSPTLLYLLQKG